VDPRARRRRPRRCRRAATRAVRGATRPLLSLVSARRSAVALIAFDVILRGVEAGPVHPAVEAHAS
jgi:hypothetical protein